MDDYISLQDLQCEHVSIEKLSKTKLQEMAIEIDAIKSAHQQEVVKLNEQCNEVKTIVQSESESFNAELTDLRGQVKDLHKLNEVYRFNK